MPQCCRIALPILLASRFETRDIKSVRSLPNSGLQIVIALILAIGLGVLLGAGNPSPSAAEFSKDLAIPCTLVLQALLTTFGSALDLALVTNVSSLFIKSNRMALAAPRFVNG